MVVVGVVGYEDSADVSIVANVLSSVAEVDEIVNFPM